MHNGLSVFVYVCVYVCVCLQEHRGVLNIKYPVEVRMALSLDVCQYNVYSCQWYVMVLLPSCVQHGIVTDWNDMEQIWTVSLSRDLENKQL